MIEFALIITHIREDFAVAPRLNLILFRNSERFHTTYYLDVAYVCESPSDK